MNHRQKLLINGTQQWVSYGSVQELVDKVTAEAYAAQRRTVILFRDYMLDWYHKYKEPKVGHNYRNNCVCQMKNHIFPFIGDIPLSAITVHDVQRIMDTLQSFSTAKQVKSLINMVMDAAIADELYKHPNPTHDKRLVMPGGRKGGYKPSLRLRPSHQIIPAEVAELFQPQMIQIKHRHSCFERNLHDTGMPIRIIQRITDDFIIGARME